jgi:hypothetical protein
MEMTMNDAIDLTLLANQVTEIGRDVGLMRITLDQSTGSVAVRLRSLDGRLELLETAARETNDRLARFFAQMQDQMARIEAKLTAARG